MNFQINIMELTPLEKSRLQYMKLYEEQIIFKSNQNKQTTFKKLMLWIIK
jgi:hypothetical protein